MPFLTITLLITSLLAVSLLDFHSAYYSLLEKAGINKRNLVSEKVEEVSQAQWEASEEFKTAFMSFQLITKFEGRELEKAYKEIGLQYKSSKKAVKSVSRKIKSIERISEMLFIEWRDELEYYQSASLRQKSQAKLEATKTSYHNMLELMKKAEQKMHPVLASLKDSRLLLKHNLNATAIDSLQNELARLNMNIDSAIKEMDSAINESNRAFFDKCDNCSKMRKSLDTRSTNLSSTLSSKQSFLF